MKFRVTDPRAIYPIVAVEIYTDDEADARRMALEAMMGCSVDEVDTTVVIQEYNDLEVVEIS